MTKKAITLSALALASSLALAQGQGVSKSEIVVGSILDFSGPLAGYGKQARNGMQLRADELNEQGGVNGRRIALKFEDSGYDPRRAGGAHRGGYRDGRDQGQAHRGIRSCAG